MQTQILRCLYPKLTATEAPSRDGTQHRPSISGRQPETRMVNGKEVEIHTWNGPDDKDNPYAQPRHREVPV